MKTMGVAKVKAHLLSLVDEVERKRELVILTRNGRPVAQLAPLPAIEADPLAIYKFGGGRIVGDIVAPANDPDEWEYD